MSIHGGGIPTIRCIHRLTMPPRAMNAAPWLCLVYTPLLRLGEVWMNECTIHHHCHSLWCVTIVTSLPIVAAIAIHCKALHTQSHHGTAAITTKGHEAAMNTLCFRPSSPSLTLLPPPSPSPTKIAAMQRPSTPPCAHSPRHCSDHLLVLYMEWRCIGRPLSQYE